MLNVTAKYVTVFNPKIKDDLSSKTLFATLSSSKKNEKDGEISYKNMYWKGRFVGTAFEKAKSLKDKDKIDILNGVIDNTYDKENKKLYVNLTIFDFAMSKLD